METGKTAISKADKELETAFHLFGKFGPKATEEQLWQVLFHISNAMELQIDSMLKEAYIKQPTELSLSAKIRALRSSQFGLDSVLLGELAEISRLRSLLVHAHEQEVQLSLDMVSKYLQIAMHFIKLKSPSLFVTVEDRPNKTLEGVCVKSKSEVIIANILTSLGIRYEYEKPLHSQTRPNDSIRPDFTIKYNDKEFYWEHITRLVDEQYRKAWNRKKKWYKDNGYFENLIISTENNKKAIDSSEIARLAESRILGQRAR